MDISVAVQTKAFLFVAVLGMALGVLYDILRCIREGARMGLLLTGIFDLFFCICAMCSLFIFILTYGQGQMRAYIWIGAILGAVLYFVGFSAAIVRVLKPAVQGLSAITVKVKRFTVRLAKQIIKKLDFPRGN